jgi:DNA polymerase-3 subunit delta
MDEQPLRDLRAAMPSGPFAPAYYVYGEDEYRKDELLRDLTNALVDPATREFNLDVFRGAETNPEQLASLLNTPPMMATRRAVVVRDTGALTKDARATLDRYLDRPAPDSVLVLVALAGTKEEPVFSSRTVVVPVQSLGGVDLERWMITHARTVHASVLQPEAAAALQGAVGSDTMQLAAELDKLASFSLGEPITTAAVEAAVGRHGAASLGDLLDAVAGRDLAKALAQVEGVLAQPKGSAVSVIMALTVQTLALWWGYHARKRGLPAHRLQGEYFTLLKETGAFPMRSWGDAVRAWAQHLPVWDGPSLAVALRALRMADQNAKDTRLASDDQLLSSLLCAMCTPATHVAATR